MLTPFHDNFLLANSHCLFLDVDGTLLEFAPDPNSVVVDKALLALLRRLERACDGALALVSGRPIADLDRLFYPLYLPVAGIHGFERRNALGDWSRQKTDNDELDGIRSRLGEFMQDFAGASIEDKHFTIAFHYRRAPHLEDRLRRYLAHLVSAHSGGLELLEGNCVIEIKPSAWSKAAAVEAFMKEPPFIGRTPIYLGDDITDLHGFDAVRRIGGHPIAVGDQIDADYRIPNPLQARKWLANILPIVQ